MLYDCSHKLLSIYIIKVMKIVDVIICSHLSSLFVHIEHSLMVDTKYPVVHQSTTQKAG